MPEISRFYGIIIFLNFKDHSPPHFHAWYNEYKVIITIEEGVVMGEMPAKALRYIFEWMELHKTELVLQWQKAQNGQPLDKIKPLK